MKKQFIVILTLLALLALFSRANAEEKVFYDYLPEGARQALSEQYNGYSVPAGAIMYEDSSAVLLVLSKAGQNIAVIMEEKDGQFETVAVSDAIIPDGVAIAEDWWILDKERQGKPFIWYSPENADEFSFGLIKDSERGWIINNGFFQSDGDLDSHLAFEMASRGTAFRVSDLSYFSPVYVPAENIDRSFAGFDPDMMKLYCETAMAQKNVTTLLPSTLEANAIPQGQVIPFAKGQTYPVYSGPGTDYERLGDEKNATVSTDNWIAVLGREGDWLFIYYNVADGRNRFGYITASALPEGIEVPELAFERRPGIIGNRITDDPLRTFAEIFLQGFMECVQLATMGDEFVYVETVEPGQPRYRGFTGGIDLRESHANKAIIHVESAPLYADASTANPIGRYYGGVELDVLQKEDGFAKVRIGGGLTLQEGYIQSANLSFGALPSDIPIAFSKAAVLPLENLEDERGYAAADAAGTRVMYSNYDELRVLGQVGDYIHLSPDTSYINVTSVFLPADWVIPVPHKYRTYGDPVSIVLAADSPTYIRPDISSRSPITLYKGLKLRAYAAGDWYFVSDNNVIPSNRSFTSTVGYLPADVCNETDASSDTFAVGMLTPEREEDSRHLYVSLNGSIDGVYGWGARFVLLG